MAVVHDDAIWETLLAQTTVPGEDSTSLGMRSDQKRGSRQPLVGNKLQPNKPRTRPSARYGPRDSLNSRNSIGRPGSKRYQRWLNGFVFSFAYFFACLLTTEIILWSSVTDFFLLELNRSLSDIEDEFEWMEDVEYYFNTTPKAPLRQIFDDPDTMKLMEPLLNVTESDQNQMMEILKRLRDTHAVTMAAALDEAAAAAAADAAKTPEVLVKPKTMDPEQSWKNLTKDNRKLLKRYADTQIMKDTHAQITEFISNKEITEKLYYWTDGFQRKIAHAAAQFYGLTSYSKDTPEGRATVLTSSPTALYPFVSVMDFLA